MQKGLEKVQINLGDGIFIYTIPDAILNTHFVVCDLCSQHHNMEPKGAGNSLHIHRDKNSCYKAALCKRQDNAKARVKVCVLLNCPITLCSSVQ